MQTNSGTLKYVVVLSLPLILAVTLNVVVAATTTNTIDGATSTPPSNSTTTEGTVQYSSTAQAQNVSSARECNLTVLDDDGAFLDELRGAFSEQAIFIYFSLDFQSSMTLYKNSSDMIDPLTWVWVIEGKGELLLTYPFDFQELSLGTLSPGVFRLSVPVDLPDDGCFQQADDSDKRRILARFIGDLVQSVDDTLMMNEDLYADKKSMVCFERQLTADEFNLIGIYAMPICTYYVFQGSAVYDCWEGGADPFSSDPATVDKHGWLGAIFALGFMLALFSPLAASFFIRHNPPVTVDGEECVALNTDLPLGLKYLLCFSFQEYKLIGASRWLFYVLAFMVIPFIPWIVSFVLRGEAFMHRTAVAYELFLSQTLVLFWFVVVYLVFLAIAMLFVLLPLYDDDFLPNSLKVNTADRRYFGFAIDMDKDMWVPNVYTSKNKEEKSKEHLRAFMYTMLYRTQMAINPAVWLCFFKPIWDKILGLLGCRCEGSCANGCRIFITVIVFLLIFPFALLVFLFLLMLNSVPLVYTLTWTISKCLYKERASEVVMAFMTMFLSFAVLFIFVAAFVYIAELLGYTFIGFVLNSDFAGSILVVVLAFGGYLIKAATSFYDKYCTLLKSVMEVAESVDKETEKELNAISENSQTEADAPADTDGIALRRMGSSDATGPERSTDDGYTHAVPSDVEDADTNERRAIMQQPPVQKLLKENKGIQLISLRLFRRVIEEYQPMYLEVGAIFLQLIIIAVVVGFGLATIVFIDSVSDIPDLVEFFATVVIAGSVPTLTLILKSPAQEENESAARSQLMEADLNHWAHCKRGKEDFASRRGQEEDRPSTGQ